MLTRLKYLRVPFGSSSQKSISKEISRHKQQKATEHELAAEEKEIFRFKEISSRCLGRIDISLIGDQGDCYPFNSPDLIANPTLMPLIHSILGEDAILSYVGLVLNFPGSCNQPWHGDGPHLFDAEPILETPVYSNPNPTLQCPAHAVNVFIPLQEINEQLGPTEFMPASHLLSNAASTASKIRLSDMSETSQLTELTDQSLLDNSQGDSVSDEKHRKIFYRKKLPGTCAPHLSTDSMLLYDYRTVHRGTINAHPSHCRHMLYLYTAGRGSRII